MSIELFDLTGKTAIVTGAGRVVGRAMAKGLADAGASLTVCARTAAEVAETAQEISHVGREALALTFDAADRSESQMIIDRTVDTYGRLDVMVVAHGISRSRPAEEVAEADWNETIAVDLTACFHCAHLAGLQMLKQGSGGSIILVSSTASLRGYNRLLPYGASKGGVDQICRQLAVEWGERGIRVNAINPGFMAHHMRGTEARYETPDMDEAVRQVTPMRRTGAPEEMVGPVLFLASDASSYVTPATSCRSTAATARNRPGPTAPQSAGKTRA